MKSRTSIAALAAPALLSLLVAGCESMSIPSLLGERNLERSRVPANSITYQCQGGKRFYLRYLDNGAAAWVILPEREFRLDRVAGDAGTRYGNGKAVLTVNGDEVALSDGPTVNYAACKVPAPSEPAKK